MLHCFAARSNSRIVIPTKPGRQPSTTNSSVLPMSPGRNRASLVAPNSSHSVQPRRRSFSRALCTCQRPIQKSKSRKGSWALMRRILATTVVAVNDHIPAVWYNHLMLLRLRSAGPLYRRVYEALRDKILSGELAAGAPLPGTRTLARDLGVSRIVALAAFEQLAAEGYIESAVGSGSRVAVQVPALAEPP